MKEKTVDLMSFEQFLDEGLKDANDRINDKKPKSVKVTDSRSGKTLYAFSLKDDEYTATSNVQGIDDEEIAKLKDISGAVYSFTKLKTFIDNLKAKYAWINTSQDL